MVGGEGKSGIGSSIASAFVSVKDLHGCRSRCQDTELRRYSACLQAPVDRSNQTQKSSRDALLPRYRFLSACAGSSHRPAASVIAENTRDDELSLN